MASYGAAGRLAAASSLEVDTLFVVASLASGRGHCAAAAREEPRASADGRVLVECRVPRADLDSA